MADNTPRTDRSRTTADRSTSARSTTRSTSSTPRAPGAKATSTARRQSAATKRSTTAKKAAATRANNQTQRRAAQAAQGPKTRVETVQHYAERAVLIQVGAALEARDRVVSTVNDVVDFATSRPNAERRLKKFERRGSTARTRVRREVRKTRTRVERELRQSRSRFERTVRRNRTRVERDLRNARREAEKDGKGLRENVAANVDLVTAQVENAVQTGLTAGAKIVGNAADRTTA